MLWLVYFLINAALLGLVSEQIHKYGGTTGAYREPGTNYPVSFTTLCLYLIYFRPLLEIGGLLLCDYHRVLADLQNAQYGHAMGLLLFTAIIGVLASVFHWALGLGAQMFIFFVSTLHSRTNSQSVYVGCQTTNIRSSQSSTAPAPVSSRRQSSATAENAATQHHLSRQSIGRTWASALG